MKCPICVVILFWFGCYQVCGADYLSPNKGNLVRVNRFKDFTKIEIVNTVDKTVQLLLKARPDSGIDVKWITETSFLVDDSEYGPTIFDFNNGKWIGRDPLMAISPDHKYVGVVFWYDDKNLAIDVREFNARNETYDRVISTLETGVRVPHLEDILRWKDEKTLLVTSEGKLIGTVRLENGTWKFVSEDRGL